MYDYEFFPQLVWRSIWTKGVHLNLYLASARERCPPLHQSRLQVRIKFSVSSVFYSIFNSLFRECDAIILNTSYDYEDVSLTAIKQWLSSMQKELHAVGPLLPTGFGTDNEEGTSIDIVTFLEEMLVQHGKRSVFLVRSFPFFWVPTKLFFLRSPLAPSIGRQFRNTLTSWSMPWLKRKHHLYVDNCFPYNNYMFKTRRFLLSHVHVPKYRSNRQTESSYQVWEW